ncbi:hypothetical protein TERTU_4266 [Teredinibacter turnerae T7901]|uniref:PDZ domain-containing protein n=1 Tax=Teredinibacter turnerae (strain ATCC 39867 / T7901) TaxID=377629 RepID=C5BI89_TERTT|nr:DUF1036 domain-containing protein [Teredinibacter turnerae]ACR11242.1 hypothetical protein TERTU_4266 [Teredinibacter turnerae T7901]
MKPLLRTCTILVGLAVSLCITAQPAHADSAKICNRTPFPIFVAYVHFSQDSAKWEKQGWYRTLPGDCTTTRASNADFYYYFAEADTNDIVAKNLNKTSSYWGGGKEENALSFCVTHKAFTKFTDDCTDMPRTVTFARRDMGGTQELTCSNCGLTIATLEQAGIAYRRLQGQIRYGKSLSDDPKGTPFRIGVEAEGDAHGPFITKVYSGLPAEHLLQPGDRIMMLDNHRVTNLYDMVFLLQEFGYRADPRKRHITIGFTRYAPTPTYYEAELPVLYYRALDDNISISEGDAAALALVDGAVFNTSPYLRCIGSFIYNEYNEIPKHQREKNCVAKRLAERARAAELHDSMAIYDFVGSLTSPRLIFKLGGKAVARSAVRRAMFAMADEAVQGAISEVGWAGGIRQVRAPELVKTMSIGAVAGGVIGFIAR